MAKVFLKQTSLTQNSFDFWKKNFEGLKKKEDTTVLYSSVKQIMDIHCLTDYYAHLLFCRKPG